MTQIIPQSTGISRSDISFAKTAGLIQTAVADTSLHTALERVAKETATRLLEGGRVLICGNGGSAAQAIHFAGEMVGAFHDRSRRAFAAIPLGTDIASTTAVANDLGYEQIFARQVQAFGSPGDILWALSTSGNSPNVLRALEEAKRIGLFCVLFTNHDGGHGRELADIVLSTPQAATPQVQELHLMYGHWLCEVIECELTR